MILVTGASGYIGNAFCTSLHSRGVPVIGVGRRKVSLTTFNYKQCDFTLACESAGFFDSIACVVHLAGRAHVMSGDNAQAEQLFMDANSDCTLKLARASIAAGVQRFIFISSIGVNGAETTDHPFSETTPPKPSALYAESKLDAESRLRQLFEFSGAELVIIRPPLVYGAHAPGNFKRLLQLVQLGFPLPFAYVHNSRSMISINNLIDFIALCTHHPAAANQLFVISDGEDLSISTIARHLATGMDKSIFFFPFPHILLKYFLSFIGKAGMYSQLYGSLTVDCSKAHSVLAWTAPYRAPQELMLAGADFINKASAEAKQ